MLQSGLSLPSTLHIQMPGTLILTTLKLLLYLNNCKSFLSHIKTSNLFMLAGEQSLKVPLHTN